MRPSLLFPMLAVLSACTGMFPGVHGSGKVISEPRTVSGFTTVSMGGDGRLTIEQTGTESLTVTTDDNLLPYIRTEVNGGTLELGLKDMTNVEPTNGVEFRLTVKSLDGLRISGSGRANAKNLSTDNLHVRISGSGNVAAQGAADRIDLDISGSGDFDGTTLRAKQADVRVSGSGGVIVNASDTLDANVSGSGSVRYVGAPHVSQHVSGSGSVERVK